LNKKLLASAITLTALAGCSSTPDINEEASIEIQSKINLIKLNGTLIKQQDNFTLAPTLSAKNINNRGMFDNTRWQFNGKTLFPSFKSKRIECSLSENECVQYTHVNSPFLKINTTQSDYGDTYQERVADGKKPGMSVRDVAEGGVLLLGVPALVLIGTPIALLAGTSNLISHGSIWFNNWVEFDHDSFYEQTVKAIQAQFGSLENYISYMASASVAYTDLSRSNKRLYAEWNALKAEKLITLDQYKTMQLTSIDAYTIEIPAFGDIQASKASLETEIKDYYSSSTTALLTEFNAKLSKSKQLYIKEQVAAYEAVTDSSSIMRFIKKYEKLDEAQLISKAKVKWSAFVKKEQNIAFNNIETIRDANIFITKYEKIDEANLVNKARELVKKATLRIQKENRDKRQVKLAKLESWRKILKVGDQTFCGRVIEAKYPMFQIAISHPLQGFSDTIWLEKDKIFEEKSGCNNRNNQLTPIYNPLK